MSPGEEGPGPALGAWLTWLLLWPYPESFRREYGPDLRAHLARQRGEPRYARRVLGTALFLWDAGGDALSTGLRLRREEREHRRLGSAGPGGERVQRVRAAAAGMSRDLRHGLRNLSRSPGFVAVFVVTLGLGIGANTAMFSVVNGVLLQPLPHDDAEQIVYLRHTAPSAAIDNALFSVPEIDDYRRGVADLDGVAEFSALTFTLVGDDVARRVRAGVVTGNYFSVMGLGAAVGRAISPGDDGPTAPAVAVLTDEYWRSEFGGDPDVVGRSMEMNGRSLTVVGVLEPSPPYPEHTDLYVNLAASPHHLDATMSHDRIHRMTEVFARLAPGATLDGARVQVGEVTARLQEAYPEAYDPGSGFTVRMTSLKDQLTARARPTFILLLATASLVLAIACANLANLTLTRVIRRGGEFAVRISLGGSRLAIRRQLLAESLILAVAGGILGVLLAGFSLDVLVRFAGRFTSRATEIGLDGSVFAYAVAVVLVSSVFFTLVPTLPGRAAIGPLLKGAGGRVSSGGRAKRLQKAMVVAQVAASCVLLIGAGLLLRTMAHLDRVDPGFESTRVLAMEIPVSRQGRSAAEVQARYEEIRRAVESLPRVESAALANLLPMRQMPGSFTTHFEIEVEGHEPLAGQPVPRANLRVVSPEYFHTLGIEVLEGRAFDSGDDAEARVVILNRAMADAPVGHTMYNPYPAVEWAEALVLRTPGDPREMVPRVRQAILGIDAQQPITDVATLEEYARERVAPRRLNTVLLTGFGVLAALIAAVGIGSVLAFSVRARVQEFGIRRAFGATGVEIRAGVLREGLTLTGIGLALGVVGAALSSRLLAGLLVGVPTWDPVTYGAAALVLGAVATAACWIPARWASRVSPVEALASE